MAREIKKILISTMPRSGTVFFFDFIAELFGYSKLDPVFTGGFRPRPPEWDAYKFDKTYLSLENGQVVCGHYHWSEDIKNILSQQDVLAIYLYRDPRDMAVSAALYIKNALTHFFLHDLFSNLSDADAITFMLSGGTLETAHEKTGTEHDFITYEGMKYYCDIALKWIAEPGVAKVRYEDFVLDQFSCLQASFQKVGVEINETKTREVAAKLNFSAFSNGRQRGEENVQSHFRKGISGDYINYFTDLHKAICKSRIGFHLIELGYEKDLRW
ncbi:MAG: sulfotransferase domain-containing protein [Nitrospinae bacterium]|nr:sulfotransferase domain-containing protein [Nitrospinota bacterium]